MDFLFQHKQPETQYKVLSHKIISFSNSPSISHIIYMAFYLLSIKELDYSCGADKNVLHLVYMDVDPSPSNFPLPFLIIAIVVLLLLSLIFSISESSFLAMNKLRLRIKTKGGDKRAVRVSKLLEKKELLINTLLLANDLVNILLSSILAAFFVSVFGAGGVAYATVVATVLLLLFGEITPKTISTRHADGIAYALSGFVLVTVTILKPASAALTCVAGFFLKFFGINLNQKKPSYTEDEIRTFIDYSSEEGAIDKNENTIMRRIFRFTDLAAADIMTPRTEIMALPCDIGFKEILEIAKETKYSRFPVFRKTIDDIVGILYVKDLVRCADALNNAGASNNHAAGGDFSVANVMRKPLFILGTKKISSVCETLRENRQTIAIVVDEYSGTDGLLTQEDIVQKIFGDMTFGNEADLSSAKSHEKQNCFIVNGSILLSEISEMLGASLTSEINETLGGWLEENLDRLPVEGDVVNYDNWQFTIENIEMRRIGKIRIQNTEQIADRGESR